MDVLLSTKAFLCTSVLVWHYTQENYDSISGWTTVWKTQSSSRFRINTDEFYPETHDEFGVELTQKT